MLLLLCRCNNDSSHFSNLKGLGRITTTAAGLPSKTSRKTSDLPVSKGFIKAHRAINSVRSVNGVAPRDCASASTYPSTHKHLLSVYRWVDIATNGFAVPRETLNLATTWHQPTGMGVLGML